VLEYEGSNAKDYPRVLDVVISPSEAMFVLAAGSKLHDTLEGGKGILESINLQNGKRIHNFAIDSKCQINTIVFNHNGTMFVTGGSDGFIRVFDIKSPSPIMSWTAHHGQVCCTRFSRSETTVYSAGLDGAIIEWNINRIGQNRDGNIVRSFQIPHHETYRTWPIVRCELGMGHDGRSFVLSSSQSRSEALVYHTSSNLPVHRISGHTSSVVSVDWHPHANRVLTGSTDQTARVSVLSPGSVLSQAKK